MEQTRNLMNDCSKEEYLIESLSMSRYYHEIPFPLTAKEVLRSENYTRVTIKGHNPKVTHSFCNFVLECRRDDEEFDYNIMIAHEGKKERIGLIRDDLSCHSLSSSSSCECFCGVCKRKLVGDVIYVYKKSSRFCSFECASLEVLVEVIMGVVNKYYSFDGRTSIISTRSDDCNDLMFFMEGITI